MNRVFCLTGLSGVGKSEVLKYCDQKGIAHFYTGDLIPSDVDESQKIDFGDTLKEENGFIKLALKTTFANNLGRDFFVIDSVRSIDEWAYVRDSYQAYLGAVICRNPVRMERIRGRDGKVGTERRDRKDLGIENGSRYNVGALIATADFYIDNSSSLEHTHRQLNKIFEEAMSNGTRS